MDTSNTLPRICKTWPDYDLHTRWRRYLNFKPGSIAWIKKQTNRRERREAKFYIQESRYDSD